MLDKIKSPVDVKKLTSEELQKLAVEVRKRIIEVSAKNGGHIAPSLGATDLAIALLKVFDPLVEQIIWDVGHQSYAYKILTERNDRFDTLRQLNGISGFNNLFESKYDAFGVGHSSTSISAAAGIAVAKDLQKKSGKTIAVIGDGALTGGMAFEGLNHSGHLHKEMLVVLNDNNMSISKNVGALQAYLTNILVSKPYNVVKGKIWDILQQFPPRLKRKLIVSAQKLEENIINTFVPNVIFEDLGFKYVGPIDGHDIPRMVSIFQKAKDNLVGPVLIHVVTQKGKGYQFAETNAAKFHGLGPFHVKTGECVSDKTPSYSQIFGDTLCKLAKSNKQIVAITAAMTDGTGLTEFSKVYPDRFFDVGIAEQHAVTFAGGLATQGLKPFVAIYSTFLQRALDQIIHDIAIQKLPVVFCLDRAGLVGEDGATHQGVFDISFLNFVPNMVIMAPANANELTAMMELAAKYKDGPVAIRYPRGNALLCNKVFTPVQYGKMEIVEPGKNLAVIGVGKAFSEAQKLAEKIKKHSPFLINARFVKPLDRELLNELKQQVKIIITLEENAKIGGFGSSIRDYYAMDDIKVISFGYPDEFIPHGTINELNELIHFSADAIYETIKQFLS
jgi:1-deoxy-D-xylulose-5-phosphate synthase